MRGLLCFMKEKISLRSPMLGETARARVSRAFADFGNFTDDDLVSMRGFEIYEKMQTDAQVRACLAIKKFSVLSRGWKLHPASDSEKDKQIAEFAHYALDNMRGSVIDVLYNALDAIAKGYSIMEINYKLYEDGRYKGMVGISSIKSKNPAHYDFETDEYLNIKNIVSKQDRRKLDAEKFVVYSYMPKYESPYGSSDLRAAYKHYLSKDMLMRFMNLYLEKYGSPTVKGSYKRGMASQSQKELLGVLEKIQQETAIVIPEDVQVELLEATRGGEAGYLQALEFHDKQIAKAILHQTLMTDEGVRVGSFALAKIHLEVLKMNLRKIKRDLEETVMQEQIIKRLIAYNFADIQSYPQFSLGPIEDKEIETLADVVAKLVDGKVVSPKENWIRQFIGIPENNTQVKEE